MWTWVSVALGALLILFSLRDISLTLLTPTGHGSISRWLMARIWSVAGTLVQRRNHEVIGPLVFVGVLIFWTVLVVVGWALIYWPFLPGSFLVDFGLDRDQESPSNFLTAIYFSMVVLATLGFGDIVPTDGWLRVLVPFEGLVGIALITAGISWFLLVHPALARRQRLAHRIVLLRDARHQADVRWDPGAVPGLFDSFTRQLVDIRSDQARFPIMHYFRNADPLTELLLRLPDLREIADQAAEIAERGRDIRLQQHMLQQAIDDYVRTIAAQFLDDFDGDVDVALDRLIRDYGTDLSTSGDEGNATSP
jgi:hypothetical protein